MAVIILIAELTIFISLVLINIVLARTSKQQREELKSLKTWQDEAIRLLNEKRKAAEDVEQMHKAQQEKADSHDIDKNVAKAKEYITWCSKRKQFCYVPAPNTWHTVQDLIGVKAVLIETSKAYDGRQK